ncbi:MAG: mechanosensitive ion channel protein MscS [Deltaproteobacteria bacterium]|jgi:small-conductance mechanosensitive channel|nr:Small-conductance mechanosensitive channel [bacterium HR37]GIW48044.1 MAG: mechanosensitive ion channel protein MscS [Deltaproteobacteria bacterium]
MGGFTGQLLEQGVEFFPRLVIAFVVLFAFWLVGTACEKALERFYTSVHLEAKELIYLIQKALKLTFIAIGVVSALGTLGINVSALIAGLGLTGFALGFALKDALSNLLAGILILIYRPVRVKDYIAVMGFQGRIVQIDLRYTVLEENGKRFLIPNSMLFTNPITVVTSEDSVSSAKVVSK